jgi:hypothetical protein
VQHSSSRSRFLFFFNQCCLVLVLVVVLVRELSLGVVSSVFNFSFKKTILLTSTVFMSSFPKFGVFGLQTRAWWGRSLTALLHIHVSKYEGKRLLTTFKSHLDHRETEKQQPT